MQADHANPLTPRRTRIVGWLAIGSTFVAVGYGVLLITNASHSMRTWVHVVQFIIFSAMAVHYSIHWWRHRPQQHRKG